MFLYPIFRGCKYTNNFLFINNIIEIQHFGLLITWLYAGKIALYLRQNRTYEKHAHRIFCNIIHNYCLLDRPPCDRCNDLRTSQAAFRNKVQKSISMGLSEPSCTSADHCRGSIGGKTWLPDLTDMALCRFRTYMPGHS